MSKHNDGTRSASANLLPCAAYHPLQPRPQWSAPNSKEKQMTGQATQRKCPLKVEGWMIGLTLMLAFNSLCQRTASLAPFPTGKPCKPTPVVQDDHCGGVSTPRERIPAQASETIQSPSDTSLLGQPWVHLA